MAEVTALREAIERDPDDADAILRLANLSFDIQRWERAGELYARYLELRPGDPDVLTDLGITLRARGEFARALELFREAQAKVENHWQSRYNEVVVLAFDLDPQLLHREHHLGAEILLGVHRRDRKIALLVTDLVPQVGHLVAARVPNAFARIDMKKGFVGRLIVAHVIKDKELCFGAKIDSIRNAGLL